MDACGGTFSVSKACMLFSKLRRFIGCEVDPSCMIVAMPQLILIVARQIFSKQPNIDGDVKVRISAKMYIKAAEAILV